MHATQRATSTTTGAPGDARRVAGARRTLPNGRAVVGGLLVSLAAVVVFAAWAGAQDRSTTTVVVAARDLEPGRRLTGADLLERTTELPAELSGGSFASPDPLLGAVTLGPVGAGELVQAGSVRTGEVADPGLELAVTVDADNALAGSVTAGEVVDLLATFGSGADARTELLAADVRVLRVGEASSAGLGAGGRLVLALALRSSAEALDVAHASQVAVLTLVRPGPGAGGADLGDPSPAPAGTPAPSTADEPAPLPGAGS